MVTEVHTQMVPVVHWRTVAEQRVEKVPVTTCRMVSETVRVRVPRLVFRCVPKTLVYKTAVLTCEEIPGDRLPAGGEDGSRDRHPAPR